MTRLALLLGGLAVAPLVLAAQEPAPAFEVASIKVNASRWSSSSTRQRANGSF